MKNCYYFIIFEIMILKGDMGKNRVLSKRHLGIIRRIAREQIESFISISKKSTIDRIKRELEEDFYQVTKAEVHLKVLEKLNCWESVEQNPRNFANILTPEELGMLRHLLIEGYGINDITRPIHGIINLKEDINKFLN